MRPGRALNMDGLRELAPQLAAPVLTRKRAPHALGQRRAPSVSCSRQLQDTARTTRSPPGYAMRSAVGALARCGCSSAA
jgi:hypothetical protein